MKPVNVGLIGWGTVGSGAVKIIIEDKDMIERRLGLPLVLKKVADLDITSKRPVDVDPAILTTDADEIINDPDIDIVIQLIGGIDAAKAMMLKAIAAGKHVVTANKALLAKHGREIFEAADKAGVEVQFEAAVAGGIPIIRTLKEGLAANNINYFFGILNGTANYILSKMSAEGVDFDTVLKEAQDKGYAEADPSLDVEGDDTAHKLAILVSLAYGMNVDLSDIYVEGIKGIDSLDIRFAAEFGFVIKLLAISSRDGKEVEARVHPAMLPADHVLAGVGGAFNAVLFNGHAVGDILLYGQGAGMMPTASSVISDCIELARAISRGAIRRVPPLAWPAKVENGLSLKDMAHTKTKYYFRFTALDKPGVLSDISGVLGGHNISISAVIQKGKKINGAVSLVMLTHEAMESDVKNAVEEIRNMDVVTGDIVLIRVEERA